MIKMEKLIGLPGKLSLRRAAAPQFSSDAVQQVCCYNRHLCCHVAGGQGVLHPCQGCKCYKRPRVPPLPGCTLTVG